MKTELTLANEFDAFAFETLKSEDMNKIEGGLDVIIIYVNGELRVSYK